jgi:hypothetical protein
MTTHIWRIFAFDFANAAGECPSPSRSWRPSFIAGKMISPLGEIGMRTRIAFVIAVAVGSAIPCWAVIQRTVPLKDVLSGESFIFTARVEKLDVAGMAMSLTIGEHFKSRFPYPGFTVDLHGDAESQKTKQPAQLIDRLAPNLELIIFGSARGSRTTLYAFTNGTWFQITGPADSPSLAFTHFEPYFRRTFKGTTVELKQAVIGGLGGKKEPPAPDSKEPPGIGPPVKK